MKLGSDRDRDRWTEFIKAQPLPLDVQCDPWKEPRKLTANAYLWAFVYGPLVEVAGHTAEEWHEYFCIEHFGGVPQTKIDGSQTIAPKRTTTKNELGQRDVLKGHAFNDFLMFVEAECAKKGVFIEREFAV